VLEGRRQNAAGSGALVPSDRVRAGGRAGGRTGQPGRLTGHGELPQHERDERDQRQDGDQLDCCLAPLLSDRPSHGRDDPATRVAVLGEIDEELCRLALYYDT
jgi:hypothetical protein